MIRLGYKYDLYIMHYMTYNEYLLYTNIAFNKDKE